MHPAQQSWLRHVRTIVRALHGEVYEDVELLDALYDEDYAGFVPIYDPEGKAGGIGAVCVGSEEAFRRKIARERGRADVTFQMIVGKSGQSRVQEAPAIGADVARHAELYRRGMIPGGQKAAPPLLAARLRQGAAARGVSGLEPLRHQILVMLVDLAEGTENLPERFKEFVEIAADGKMPFSTFEKTWVNGARVLLTRAHEDFVAGLKYEGGAPLDDTSFGFEQLRSGVQALGHAYHALSWVLAQQGERSAEGRADPEEDAGDQEATPNPRLRETTAEQAADALAAAAVAGEARSGIDPYTGVATPNSIRSPKAELAALRELAANRWDDLVILADEPEAAAGDRLLAMEAWGDAIAAADRDDWTEAHSRLRYARAAVLEHRGDDEPERAALRLLAAAEAAVPNPIRSPKAHVPTAERARRKAARVHAARVRLQAAEAELSAAHDANRARVTMRQREALRARNAAARALELLVGPPRQDEGEEG